VTVVDQIIGWGYLVPTVAIFGILAFALGAVFDTRKNARADAGDDAASAALRARWGWETLRGRFGPAVRSIAPASHRARWQFPDWMRTLTSHGAAPEPAGYDAPPPLVSEPVVSRTDWVALDRYDVPVVGQAPVVRRDRWEALDVVDDVLRGRMRAAANTEDTGLIEPVQAEVIQW
jgi:hypothetical protein